MWVSERETDLVSIVCKMYSMRYYKYSHRRTVCDSCRYTLRYRESVL